MKKVFSIFAIGAVVAIASAFTSNTSVEVNDEQRAIAVAKAAITQECGTNTGNADVNVQENFICNDIDGGFGNMNRTITFTRPVQCPPNQICIQIVEIIGSVVVDCEFNAVEVVCGGLITQ